jgi:protein-disulfide isomerase
LSAASFETQYHINTRNAQPVQRGSGPSCPARDASSIDLRQNVGAFQHTRTEEIPLSGKQQPNQTSRRDRRAAERKERFEVAREQRRSRSGGSGGSGASLFTTRNITIVAVIAGLVIVAVVAFGQLGNRVSGTFLNPGITYPASVIGPDRTLGSSSAPVTLEVYEDFQCPICARYSLTEEPLLVSQYVSPGTLRIVHHDIAILGRGGADDESKLAATGAACAVDQGKYWDYAHWVYRNQDGENQGGFRRDRLTAIAEAAGLDGTTFSTCLDSVNAIQQVTDITNQAVSMGINSTPTMYIGDQQIVGLKSAQELGALIEAAAASASPGGASAAPGSASPSTVP